MKIAVVIPCYRVRDQILKVLSRIGGEVERIFVVDDCCPQKSGDFVEEHSVDPRVRVLRNERNLGVGGAVLAGYRAALAEGWDIVVKLDGDGQMDPSLIPGLTAPIQSGTADYCKGSRFFSPRTVESMPLVRLIGNSFLSFFAKAATGHWHIMDPNNGFTAIHSVALRLIPLEKLAQGYFFETDILFRLYTIEATVCDFPMVAVYGEEKSNLNILRVLLRFPLKYVRSFLKRIAYMYFVRDFNAASLQLLVGSLLTLSGFIFGSYSWASASMQNRFASSGTVMLAGAQLILGVQFLLAAVSYDVSRTPRQPLSLRLAHLFEGRKKGKQSHIREVVG